MYSVLARPNLRMMVFSLGGEHGLLSDMGFKYKTISDKRLALQQFVL